jgi:hypothetical protein
LALARSIRHKHETPARRSKTRADDSGFHIIAEMNG